MKVTQDSGFDIHAQFFPSQKLVDLKAALFQKQQQVKKEKAAQQHDTALPREVSDKVLPN